MPRLRTAILATLGTLSAMTPAAFAAPCSHEPAGVIVDYEGPPGGYRLTRGDRSVPIAFFLPLATGDRLEVLLPKGVIGLQAAEGKVRRLRRDDGPLCLDAGKPVTWLTNIVTLLGDRLQRDRDTPGPQTVSRGDGDFALAFEDLNSDRAIVAGGNRFLALAWRGGEAPFRAVVRGPSGAAIVDEVDLPSRRLSLRQARDLAPGRYRVEIIDASGQTASGGFKAVGREDAAPDPVADLATAAQLYEAERLYDAYLRLDPHRDASSMARDFMAFLYGDP